jgi:nucleoside triphosphate pyrophosphatase
MLVLASASPRRQELLRNADLRFTVQAASVSEVPFAGESPKDCAERLAGDKARAVSRLRPHDFVLGADTIVVVDGLMLGKPRDPADAARMLGLLSGRAHEVITGVCLMGPGESAAARAFADTRSESTRVVMQPLSEQDLASYVRSGEPMDKAGAYAIQGIASRWISRIEGDYFNVVGLPVSLVFRMLREHGSI